MISYKLPENYAFSILRKGKKIGEHKIAFSEKDGNTIVDIDINIRVGVGPITFYRYEHSNQEIWDDEGLLEITTATNENGKSFALEGKRKDEGFEIIKGEEPGMVEASIIPTSYWRMETLNVTRVLDTQNGKILDVAVDLKGDAGDLGTKYIMSGELELDLWYTDDRLTKIAFDAEGASIEYGPLKGDDS